MVIPMEVWQSESGGLFSLFGVISTEESWVGEVRDRIHKYVLS